MITANYLTSTKRGACNLKTCGFKVTKTTFKRHPTNCCHKNLADSNAVWTRLVGMWKCPVYELKTSMAASILVVTQLQLSKVNWDSSSNILVLCMDLVKILLRGLSCQLDEISMLRPSNKIRHSSISNYSCLNHRNCGSFVCISAIQVVLGF